MTSTRTQTKKGSRQGGSPSRGCTDVIASIHSLVHPHLPGSLYESEAAVAIALCSLNPDDFLIG
jgi:hypothetical protein